MRNGERPGGATPGDGAALLSALFNATRALQLYPAENEAVRRAFKEVEARARHVFEKEGGLSLWLAGNFIFVNDLRVRLDFSDYETLAGLREMLRGHGIGRIDAEPKTTIADWTHLLGLVAGQASDGEPPLESARRRLREAGVTRIAIGPPAPLFTVPENEETLEAARETYARSVQAVKDVMGHVVSGRGIHGRRAERAVLRIVDQVLNDRASMMGMVTLRDYDDHSFIHSVNCGILAVALGSSLGFAKQQLFELGFAALFHDIGKLLVPTSVLNKQGWLNDEEWRMVSQHPDFGFLMLFHAEGFTTPPYRAMLAIYEHHMKPDLSGYPRVIRRRRQGLFARIIAVVEAYDAAVSSHSKQFLPCSPDEAIRQLQEAESEQFDRVVVKAFVNMMGIYPVGTLVILDTGEMGVVVAANPNPKALSRPLVRLISKPDGVRIGDGPVVDLTEVDGSTGRPRRTIARAADSERYNVRVADHVA